MIMAIPATVSLAEASARFWDAIVVGAGPAGSLAARELVRNGLSVLLVDHARFPRTKVCGCCLNLRAMATLAQTGLGNLVPQCGAVPLQRLILATSGSQASVPFLGMALSRDAFDAALVEAAIEAGVCFLPETHAVLCPLADPLHRITLLRHQGQELPAQSRVVLGAGGLGSNLHGDQAQHSIVESASRLGAGVIVEQYPKSIDSDTVYMVCAKGGYVGLVRLENGRLNIAAAFDAPFVKRAGGVGKAAAVVLGHTDFPPIENLEHLGWHGTPQLTRHASRPAAHRLFLLGDAASFVEPFTGEGMAWALASGAAVARFAVHACRAWDATLIGKWTHCHRQKILRRQSACRIAAYVLRQPTLVRLVTHALYHFPILATPVIRYINSAVGVGN